MIKLAVTTFALAIALHSHVEASVALPSSDLSACQSKADASSAIVDGFYVCADVEKALQSPTPSPSGGMASASVPSVSNAGILAQCMLLPPKSEPDLLYTSGSFIIPDAQRSGPLRPPQITDVSAATQLGLVD